MTVRTLRCRCGFTFVELCIGMVVTAMVLGALAAFTLATAKAWDQGVSTNAIGGGQSIASIPVVSSLAAVRLDNELSNADGFGGYYSGNLNSASGQQASLLLWNDANSDGTITNNEIELLDYDATDHVLYKWTSTSTVAPAYSAFAASSYIATFKTVATKIPLARNVDGMQFYAINPASATQYPLVEYRMFFTRSGRSQTRYGAVCLRSPTTAQGMVLS